MYLVFIANFNLQGRYTYSSNQMENAKWKSAWAKHHCVRYTSFKYKVCSVMPLWDWKMAAMYLSTGPYCQLVAPTSGSTSLYVEHSSKEVWTFIGVKSSLGYPPLNSCLISMFEGKSMCQSIFLITLSLFSILRLWIN